MIKRDTEYQPVAPSGFPYPAQFPMLIPTRIFPLWMLSQVPSIDPCLLLYALLDLIHSAASIGRGPLHSAPLKVINHRLQHLLQSSLKLLWKPTRRAVSSFFLLKTQSYKIIYLIYISKSKRRYCLSCQKYISLN